LTPLAWECQPPNCEGISCCRVKTLGFWPFLVAFLGNQHGRLELLLRKYKQLNGEAKKRRGMSLPLSNSPLHHLQASPGWDPCFFCPAHRPGSSSVHTQEPRHSAQSHLLHVAFPSFQALAEQHRYMHMQLRGLKEMRKSCQKCPGLGCCVLVMKASHRQA
jgi:hypothetical protein